MARWMPPGGETTYCLLGICSSNSGTNSNSSKEFSGRNIFQEFSGTNSNSLNYNKFLKIPDDYSIMARWIPPEEEATYCSISESRPKLKLEKQ